MYSPTPPPPVPPPKPSSHDASRLGTPAAANSPRPPPGLELEAKGKATATEASGLIPAPTAGDNAQAQEPVPEDPGEQWLPKVLEDKSKQDLAAILSSPALLTALTHAPSTIHPSLAATHAALQEALDANTGLARHLASLETHLGHQRAGVQAQLLSTHALERQWRAKQAEMDAALAPFGPAALYGRLTAALAEQEGVCAALEESFLDGGSSGGSGGRGEDGGDGDGKLVASEREILDWVRRYRDAKKLFYLRQERKERWNERRVGGWR